MSEQPAAPAPEQQQQQAPSPDPTPNDDQARAAAALKELGIEPDEQGRIPLADHQKLLTAVGALREQVRSHETAKKKADAEAEKARLAAMGEQERALEEARKKGYEEAAAEHRGQIIRTQALAAATGAGFTDPGDAARYLDFETLKDEAAVAAAVAKLAKDKPYLLKATGPARQVEQGPQGGGGKGGEPGADWLFDELNRKRRGA